LRAIPIRNSFFHRAPFDMSKFSTSSLLVWTGLAIVVAGAIFLPREANRIEERAISNTEMEHRPSAPEASDANTPVLKAGIGLLPNVGGVALDLIVLAVFGIGYGIWRLRQSKTSPPAGTAQEVPETTRAADRDPHPLRRTAKREHRSRSGRQGRSADSHLLIRE